jgi:hypothetical protein
LVSLKTQSAGDDYPKKEIEKTVLRFLGSRTFSHGLDPKRSLVLSHGFGRYLPQSRRSPGHPDETDGWNPPLDFIQKPPSSAGFNLLFGQPSRPFSAKPSHRKFTARKNRSCAADRPTRIRRRWCRVGHSCPQTSAARPPGF